MSENVPLQPKTRHSGSRRQAPTKEHLEKKRRTDRESQRVVRERTKKYISHLEDLVDTLQTSHDDDRLQNMTLQCKKLHDENEQLRTIITSITRLTRGIEMPEPSRLPKHEAEPASESIFLAIAPLPDPQVRSQTFSCAEDRTLIRHTMGTSLESSSSDKQSPNKGIENFGLDLQTGLHHPSTSPSLKLADSSSISYESENVFVAINSILSQAESLPIPSMKPDQDADIAIRAIAQGWVLTEKRYDLDPVWKIIRQIEQDIFCCCGPIEKLALLRVLRMKVLQQMTSARQEQIETFLPPYMHSRSVQNSITHPSIIDYFVWPELREFLILSGQNDASNLIAAAFASNLRFRWPFDLRDAWARNRHTDMYSFSKLFDERFDDVTSWALTSNFFDMYPELTDYIPSYNPLEEVPLVA